jgi:lipoteichoic acid synthase
VTGAATNSRTDPPPRPMNPRTPQAFYPFGLALFALLLAVYKAATLTSEMGADWYRFLILLGLDAFFLALIFILGLLPGYVQLKWLRAIVWLALTFLAFYYLVDSFVLLALDEHASLFEIGRYAPEWGVVLSFFDTTAYMAILLFLISMFLFLKSTPAVIRFGFGILGFTLLLAVLSTVSAPQALRAYAMLSPQDILQGMAQQQATASYSGEEIEFYAGLERETAVIPASKPNIILLIIESLSSINSTSMSGGPGLLDGFDELAEEGVLFRNFFANHQASEGGLIALLGGFPPMHFPTASPYMFDEFAIQPSVISEYRRQGYFTEFLTSADLDFIGLDHFLAGLDVDRSRGRDDVDAMRVAPRVVQDAPSDSYLYREALLSVQNLMSTAAPFLLTIATTSTHLPYTHPESGPDTPEAVWEWSMQQLLDFYSQLFESGYFENGILLITGDHRQMRPLSDAEIERYGGSARARVPLLVVGGSFPRGQVDDRFFQQSDLLRMLGRIDNEGASLSPHPIWVERYNRKYGRVKLINNLSVFDEADQGRLEYRLKVPGNRIEWLDKKPVFARRVETRIHSQRSIHQQTRKALNHKSVENQ